MIRSIRDEALLILQGRGAILDVAREVTVLMRGAGIDGAIIGGVAVVLHGYVRTTQDINVYVGQSRHDFARILKSNDFEFDSKKREFLRDGVPIRLVTVEQTGIVLGRPALREEIRVANLHDLISMKLRSGTANLTRANDIADVIGLIRANHLTSSFAAKLDLRVRGNFRVLARAVAKERS